MPSAALSCTSAALHSLRSARHLEDDDDGHFLGMRVRISVHRDSTSYHIIRYLGMIGGYRYLWLAATEVGTYLGVKRYFTYLPTPPPSDTPVAILVRWPVYHRIQLN